MNTVQGRTGAGLGSLGWVKSSLAGVLTSSGFGAAHLGSLTGLCAVACGLQWIMHSGVSSWSLLTAQLAVGLSISSAILLPRRFLSARTGLICTSVAALLMVTLPWIWSGTESLRSDSIWGWLIPAVLTLSLPAGLLVVSARGCSAECSVDDAIAFARNWCGGGAAGICLAACCGALFSGMSGSGWLIGVIALAAVALQVLHSRPVNFSPSPSQLAMPHLSGSLILTLGMMFVSGCGIAVVLSLAASLMPVTFYFASFAGVGLFCGAAIGLRRRDCSRVTPLLSAVGVIALGLLAYPWLVYQIVQLSADVQWVFTQQLIRGLGLICGLSVWGCLATRTLRQQQSATGLISFAAWGCLLAGGVLTQLLLRQVEWSVAAWCVVGALCLLILVEVIQLPQWKLTWFHRLQIAAGGTGVLMTLLFGGAYDPALSARLLFSTHVFVNERLGTPHGLLTQLDESRLISSQQTEYGVATAWKLATARLQLRVNGIPAGTLALNTTTVPQYSGEVLPVVLPLALHEQPQRVALLGFGCGVSWQTALSSPLQQVTVVESDQRWLNWVRQLTAKSSPATFWKDERTQWQSADPLFWTGTSAEDRYDVVVSDPPQAFLLRGVSYYSTEFYHRIKQRLAEGGIFCQRFQTIDYGPQPLLDVQATLQQAFAHVLVVEMGAGEVVLLGTDSPAGLIRPGLIERLQASHVRDQLAELNWDWSVLLTLPAYSQEEFAGVQQAQPGRVLQASTGRWACVLPNELLRWSPKQQELQQRFAEHTGKLLNWVGEDGEKTALLQRLEEVQGQQRLMANYNDHYWGYRSQVKEQIARRPLSPIQRVRNEKGREGAGLSLEDKRRLRYFQQIATALKTGSPEEIRRLKQYEIPFDPLVSYFMHQEVAEIYRKTGRVDPAAELAHRLHSLYYTSPADRSLQNLLSAIRLVLEEPTAVPSDSERWDTLNALLSLLQSRWEARSQAEPGIAKEVLRDTDASIVLAEKTLDRMRELAPSVACSTADFQARKHVIERQLISPLRNYRNELQPHVTRQESAAEQAAEGTELDTGITLSEEDAEALR